MLDMKQWEFYDDFLGHGKGERKRERERGVLSDRSIRGSIQNTSTILTARCFFLFFFPPLF